MIHQKLNIDTKCMQKQKKNIFLIFKVLWFVNWLHDIFVNIFGKRQKF